MDKKREKERTVHSISIKKSIIREREREKKKKKGENERRKKKTADGSFVFTYLYCLQCIIYHSH